MSEKLNPFEEMDLEEQKKYSCRWNMFMKKLILSVISAVMVLTLTACIEESLREKIITDTETTVETKISKRVDNNIDYNDGKSVFDIAKNITFDDEHFEFPITTDKLDKKYKSVKEKEDGSFNNIFLKGKNLGIIMKNENFTYANAHRITLIYDPKMYIENNQEYCTIDCQAKCNTFAKFRKES